ncbi:MAG: oligosaccharide flippase family protein [Flavobacteriaceae bacterium]|nr:oligosaccharide flippase family protein [Flavobacteriaceae bacterium]
MFKRLLGQTAVYGLSAVLVRVFPFLINPIVTRAFSPEASAPFVDWYSVAGVITVLLTHGMETSFFRFAQEKEIGKSTLISTGSASVLMVCLVYLVLGYGFREELAYSFQTPDQVDFLVLFLFILSIDAMAVIPSAVLRLEGKPIRYMLSKVVGALVYFGLVVFFINILPQMPNGFLGLKYDADFGVGYIFVANLIQSIITLLIVSKELVNFNIKNFDFALWKRMLNYSWPIMVAGLAGIVNQTLDRQFLKFLLPESEANHQIGVYGAVYKIATFIVVFRQAYQLGIEPYFFSSFKNENAKKTYRILMDIFVICNCLIFLALMVNISWISQLYLRNPLYFEGIEVVPYLMLGAVFLGIYLNLSIWYKLSDQTIVGLYISLIGATITILGNWIFVPIYGYWASAITSLCTFFMMMIISYIWGKIKYPIPYNVGKITLYLVVSSVFGWVAFAFFRENFFAGNMLLAVFLLLVVFLERKLLRKIIKK